MEGGDEGIERIEDSKDLQQQSKALDKLTDHVDDRQLDSTRIQKAMASIAASKEADLSAMRLREKKLAAVKINAAEVDIIANELELDKKVAERTLREHKGDAADALGICFIHFGRNMLSGPIPQRLFNSNMTLIHLYVTL
ncbi:putative nascent polypeptide-associated complex subunit alpha-like, UBA domain-containing protein [Helianthus anomalus]